MATIKSELPVVRKELQRSPGSQLMGLINEGLINEGLKLKTQASKSHLRANSVEELTDLLRNPYQLTQGELPRAKKPSKRRDQDPVGPQTGRKQPAAKSVPFGSSSRRPVGEKSLDEIVNFTYLPDMRYLNALNSVQLKEEREVAKKHQSLSVATRKGHSQSEQKLTLQNSSTALSRRYDSNYDQSMQRDFGQLGGPPALNLHHPRDIKGQAASVLSRSKSTHAKKAGRLAEQHLMQQAESAALLLRKRQDSQNLSYEQTLGIDQTSRGSIDHRNHKLGRTPSIDVSQQIIDAQLPKVLQRRSLLKHMQGSGDLSTLNAPTPSKIENRDISIQIGDDQAGEPQPKPQPYEASYKDELKRAEKPRHSVESSVTALDETHLKFNPGAGPRYKVSDSKHSSLKPWQQQQYDVAQIYETGLVSSQTPISNSDPEAALQREHSRILLKQSSVQQINQTALSLESNRKTSNSKRSQGTTQKNKSASRLRKSSKKKGSDDNKKLYLLNGSDAGSSKSIMVATGQQAGLDGLFQARKLAPSESQRTIKYSTAGQREGPFGQPLGTIQQQRQRAMAENELAFNQMASEFLDQLNANKMASAPSSAQGFLYQDQVKTSNKHQTSSLPALPRNNRDMEPTSYSQFFDASTLRRDFSSSKLLVSKRKLQQQFQTTKHQQRELVTVLAAQGKVGDAYGAGPWEAYISKTKLDGKDEQPLGVRSIPLKRADQQNSQTLTKLEPSVPRRTLQQEVSNERSYSKISLRSKQPGLQRRSSAVKSSLNQSVPLVAESEAGDIDNYQEIIPRLYKFPMGGRTIQVKGHDENNIFTTSKKRKKPVAAEQVNENQALDPQQMHKKGQKVRSLWNSVHGSRTGGSQSVARLRSIDKLLSTDPTKKDLSNIINQKGVRKHYLDDEIKKRSYMEDVGPTSYETVDRISCKPVDLQPLVAPAIIYKDFVKKAPLKDKQPMQYVTVANDTQGDVKLDLGTRHSIESQQSRNVVHQHRMDKETTPSMTLHQSPKHKAPAMSRGQSANKQIEASPYGASDVIESTSELVKQQETQQLLQEPSVAQKRKKSKVRKPTDFSVADSIELSSSAAYQQIILPVINDHGQGTEASITVNGEDQSALLKEKTETGEGWSKRVPHTLTASQATHSHLQQPNRTVFVEKPEIKFRQYQKHNSRMGNQTQSHSQVQMKFKQGPAPNKSQDLVSLNLSVKRITDLQQRRKSDDLSNKDIDAVLNESDKASNMLSNVDQEGLMKSQTQVQGHTNQFSVKIPTEMYERQEVDERERSNQRKKGLKGLTMGNLNARNAARERSRDLGVKVSSAKIERLTLPVPEAGSYQMSGPVYYADAAGLTSQRLVASKDNTPVRKLEKSQKRTEPSDAGYSARRGGHKTKVSPAGRKNLVALQPSTHELHLNGSNEALQLRLMKKDSALLGHSGNGESTQFDAVDDSQVDSGIDPLTGRKKIVVPTMTYTIAQEDEIEVQPDMSPTPERDLPSSRIKLVLSISQNSLERARQSEVATIEAQIESHRTPEKKQSVLISQALEQVKNLKKERESKQGKKSTLGGGIQLAREPRFKHSLKEIEDKKLPGPGHYQTVHPKDIQTTRSRSVNKPKPPSVMSQQLKPIDQKPWIEKSLSGESLQSVQSKEKLITEEQLTARRLSGQTKSVSPNPKRSSANFVSKVPKFRQPDNQIFTGEVDFNDQRTHTISKAQNELTLKTVQKMFAGRKEQHTVNVHKLVRINRLKQLNKADPLINADLPMSQSDNNTNHTINIETINLPIDTNETPMTINQPQTLVSHVQQPADMGSSTEIQLQGQNEDYRLIILDGEAGAGQSDHQLSANEQLELLRQVQQKIAIDSEGSSLNNPQPQLQPKGGIVSQEISTLNLQLLQQQPLLSTGQTNESLDVSAQITTSDRQTDAQNGQLLSSQLPITLMPRESLDSIQTLAIQQRGVSKDFSEGADNNYKESGHGVLSSQPLSGGIQSGRYSFAEVNGMAASDQRDKERIN